ncbi:MAG: hypothetical protein IJ092_01695 [Atopobiaceae bacterium]|nr:hypothetical protein [Atopobiaceae bacterium]
MFVAESGYGVTSNEVIDAFGVSTRVAQKHLAKLFNLLMTMPDIVERVVVKIEPALTIRLRDDRPAAAFVIKMVPVINQRWCR